MSATWRYSLHPHHQSMYNIAASASAPYSPAATFLFAVRRESSDPVLGSLLCRGPSHLLGYTDWGSAIPYTMTHLASGRAACRAACIRATASQAPIAFGLACSRPHVLIPSIDCSLSQICLCWCCCLRLPTKAPAQTRQHPWCILQLPDRCRFPYGRP